MAALAHLDDSELQALIVTVDDCPQFAPGFLAWIEHGCDWEQNRRPGVEFSRQPPDAAIEPTEDGDSIGAAMIMRESFAQDDRTEVVTVLLDAIVAVLTWGTRRH